ncbi:MAG: hypothetical protein ACJA02_000267 [Myxococcota bacterium]|jgi:hypothetical protein
MIGIFGALGIISDIISLSQGEVPLGSVVKMMPSPFAKKKRGMSGAQTKKKMMMMKRRQMRNLVDTVIAPKEKKMQQKRLEDRINEEKARIDKKKKSTLPPPRISLSPNRLKRTPNQSPVKYSKKYSGNYYDEDEEEKKDKHLSMIQHVLAQEKPKQGESFVDKVKTSRGEDGSSKSR